MTWTYTLDFDLDTATGRRNYVRLLIGDNITADEQVQDEEIDAGLSQAQNDVYSAAIIMCRTLAAKYARLVDTAHETLRDAYSQRLKAYNDLAARLQTEGRKWGSIGIGVPSAGGISIAAMESANQETDRVQPAFKEGQFRNPNFRRNASSYENEE